MNLKEMRYNRGMSENAYTRRFQKDPQNVEKTISEIEEETYFELANEGKPVDNAVDNVDKVHRVKRMKADMRSGVDQETIEDLSRKERKS